MFTGIVEGTGRIRAVEDRETTRRFRIETELGGALRPGDSVSVDGACLTATEAEPGGFWVDVIGTTLSRTIAGRYVDGSLVNLERALEVGSRMDGHLVQGHVDGIGHVTKCMKDGEFWRMELELPADVASQTVARGSITLNGVSLTVAEMVPGGCAVGLIPYTWEHTNLGGLAAGDPVNVEGDLIGKYVGKMLAQRGQAPA